MPHLRPKAALRLPYNLENGAKPRDVRLLPPNPLILQYSLSPEEVPHPPIAQTRTLEAVLDIRLSPAWIRHPDPGWPLPALPAQAPQRGLPRDNAQQKNRGLHPSLETKQTYATPGQCRLNIQLSGNWLCPAFSKEREPSRHLMEGFPS